MRSFALLLLVAFAGCQIGLQADSVGNGSGSGSGSGSGVGPRECAANKDCVLAGVKCCDCPTFAVPISDPTHKACVGVSCPPSSCSTSVRAECHNGACVRACAPMVCATSCADGFALDSAGCLTCACAATADRSCSVDADCSRVRADCCGCQRGGTDTAVPNGQIASHDAALMCPAYPSCPSVDTCAANLAPRCIQGMCDLIAGGLPPNACGRPDLPACTDPDVCTVNVDSSATMQGVGVCSPP